MNNIVSIKLVTGEEIVGRLTSETSETITLEKPVMLTINQKGMGFAPVCISVDDASEFTFKQAHVLFKAETRKEIVDPYIQATTGIQLATSL